MSWMPSPGHGQVSGQAHGRMSQAIRTTADANRQWKETCRGGAQSEIDAITKLAMQHQEAAETAPADQQPQSNVPGAASGSGQSDAERKASVDAQNQRQLEEAQKMSLDDQQVSRGTKRAGDENDDSERLRQPSPRG